MQSLKLTAEQQTELKELLDKKYKVTSIKGIDLILTRIKENLSLSYRDEPDGGSSEDSVVDAGTKDKVQ